MFRIYFLLPLLIPLALVKGELLGKFFHPIERWAGRLAARPALVWAGGIRLLPGVRWG